MIAPRQKEEECKEEEWLSPDTYNTRRKLRFLYHPKEASHLREGQHIAKEQRRQPSDRDKRPAIHHVGRVRMAPSNLDMSAINNKSMFRKAPLLDRTMSKKVQSKFFYHSSKKGKPLTRDRICRKP